MPFFNSLWKIPPSCFSFPLYRFQGAFCSVLNSVLVLCCFSQSSISSSQLLRWQPFLAKTIQGSLHLICIINRLHEWATSKRKENKCRNEQDGGGILKLCPDLLSQQAWLPCLLGNASFLCCSISFRTTNCPRLETTLRKKKKTNQPFIEINVHLQEEFLWMKILNLTEILTNHVWLLTMGTSLVIKLWKLLTFGLWVAINFEPCPTFLHVIFPFLWYC